MIATLTGTMLAPGVSKNGRLYTPELIEKAVSRMQARISDPDGRPIVMRTHHDAGDDTGRIVGHLTGVKLAADGSAKYEAVLNNTAAARDTLAAAGDDARSLRNVSIYGWWVGRPRTARQDGQPVETADDLEIDAVDFTAFPGVDSARIDSVTPAKSGKAGESNAGGRHIVTESVDAEVSFVDEADKAPYGDVKYADPGYQKDKVKRYPLDTKDHAKAAWSYINQAKNAALYNATQLNAVRSRIKGALKKFGVTVTNESVHPAKLLGETAIGECICCDDDRGAGFSISANNGPIHVNISAWDGIDPAELEVIAAAAMQAACDALKALDPDMDADIDVPGAPNADSDGDMGEGKDDQMESALPPVTATPKDMAAFLARKKATASETTQTPAPTPAGPTVKESAMTDAPKAAETAAPTTESAEKPLTASDLTAALTEAFKPLGDVVKALAETVKAPQTPAAEAAATEQDDREAAPAAAETAPPATAIESTLKVDVASEAKKAAKEAVREAIPELLESFGVPRRKGLARESSESAAQQTPEQLWANRGQVWDQFLPGGTPAAPVPPAAPAAD